MSVYHLFSSAQYWKVFLKQHTRSGFKTSDQVQGQGVPRIESGVCTLVREHFDARNNAATGP